MKKSDLILSSKFILDGVKAEVVKGIMTDKELLEKERKRIWEATWEKFEEYRKASIKALKLAKERWLD